MQATSKLRSPLPSADRPLLRVRGRYLSVDAAMPTMNISTEAHDSIFLSVYHVDIKCAQLMLQQTCPKRKAQLQVIMKVIQQHIHNPEMQFRVNF